MTVSIDLLGMTQTKRVACRLEATMVSGQGLAVTDAFGLRNQAIYFGPTGADAAEALIVPARLLLDKNGLVRWMGVA